MIGYKAQEHIRTLFFNLLLIVSSLLAVGPVAWIWISSLKTNKEIRESALELPRRLNFGNYVEAWIEAHFDLYMLNSLWIGLLTVLVVLVAGSLAAFAFARMQFRGNQVLFFLIFAGMTFPVTARIAPLLTWMYQLNLVDTRWGLILAYAGGALPFAILMMRSFFRQFPQELEDAARIDGCSNLQFFGRILLPLSTPALFTLGIFTFMGAWNEFLIALLLINQDAIRTLPLGLMAFQGEFTTNYALSFAGINIAAVPVFVVYVTFQRNFIAGITAGSLK